MQNEWLIIKDGHKALKALLEINPNTEAYFSERFQLATLGRTYETTQSLLIVSFTKPLDGLGLTAKKMQWVIDNLQVDNLILTTDFIQEWYKPYVFEAEEK